MRIRRIAVFSLLVMLHPNCTLGQQAGIVPLRLEKGLPYVTCTVGTSGPLRCLLDTGSAMTGVSKQLAERLKLKTHVDASNPRSDIAAEALDSLELQVGDRRWSAVRTSIAPADLDLLDRETGTEFHTDVVIGTEILEHYQLTVDPDSLEVRFTAPGTAVSGSAEKLNTSMMGIPFTILMLKTVDGHTEVGPFSLDTGSRPSLILSRPFWSKRPALATSGNANPQAETLSLAAIRIGHTTMSDVPAIEPQHGSGLVVSEKAGGVIGGPLLNHFIVVYDVPNNSVWLTPSRRNPPR